MKSTVPLSQNRTVNDLQYVLLPGRFNPGFEGSALYDKAYDYWLKFWNQVYVDNGTTDQADGADFQRADIVALLISGDEIASMHLYSIVNLENAASSHYPYFAGEHGRSFYEALKPLSLKTAMTLEYLTVNPDWRKSKIGFSLTPVVCGLAYEIQKTLKVDVTLGRCRQDVRSHELMLERGGQILLPDIVMHKTSTHFCVLRLDDLKPHHPDPVVTNLTQSFWMNRRDLTGKQATIALSAAA